MQMVDVHFPTTDGRELIFRRYTQPEKDQKMQSWSHWLGVAEGTPRPESRQKEICSKTNPGAFGADLLDRVTL